MKRILMISAALLLASSALAQPPSPAAVPPPGAGSATSTATVTPPAREHFHIYLLMGQSNMVGRDIRSLASQVDNPRVLALNHDNQWVVAREPITYDTQKPVGQGPGIPFANEMLKTGPGITIGLVPCAVGGTPLSRWVKGADLYEACMVRAKLVAPAGVITGVLWHQGEADTIDKQLADTYQARLTQMFTGLRTDLGRPDLPIVVGQLGPFLDPAHYTYVATVRSVLERMPTLLPHLGYADSAGLTDRGDHLHFSADSQKIFGARYAHAMQELVARN
ncbi:MAG TPA: sialate O-acetylesterase [Acidobacteriaceae bacterium]|nr:sialate O-acetylesterase [Acidobacteriaceae bacterium]